MREMKDSGVPWIGEIPKGWSLRRIGQMYKERRTKVSDRDFEPLSVTMKGVVPQLSTAAKTDAHDDRKLVRKGDFAINSRSDRRGSCGIAAQDGSVSLINTIMCPLSETNSTYLNWLFHSTLFADEFYRWGHGIVDDLWTTNWSDMKRIYIPYPPLFEQQRIADFLDAKCAEIDSILENTRASLEEYKALKLSVITEAVTKGIRGERPMDYSGVEWIGKLPVEWRLAKTKTVCSKISDGSHFSPETVDEGFPYITAKDVHGIGLNYEVASKISKESFDALVKAGCQPTNGDVLLVKDGATTGRVGLVDSTEPCVLLSSVAMLHTNEMMEPLFLYYLLQSSIVQEQIKVSMAGSAMPRITLSKIVDFYMTLPLIDEQQEIAAYLDEKCAAIDSLIASKEALIAELEAYKKSLIYEYVTGKKEVI